MVRKNADISTSVASCTAAGQWSALLPVSGTVVAYLPEGEDPEDFAMVRHQY